MTTAPLPFTPLLMFTLLLLTLPTPPYAAAPLPPTPPPTPTPTPTPTPPPPPPTPPYADADAYAYAAAAAALRRLRRPRRSRRRPCRRLRRRRRRRLRRRSCRRCQPPLAEQRGGEADLLTITRRARRGADGRATAYAAAGRSRRRSPVLTSAARSFQRRRGACAEWSGSSMRSAIKRRRRAAPWVRRSSVSRRDRRGCASSSRRSRNLDGARRPRGGDTAPVSGGVSGVDPRLRGALDRPRGAPHRRVTPRRGRLDRRAPLVFRPARDRMDPAGRRARARGAVVTADLDAIMERRRDDAASVDTCVRCETPFGDPRDA